MLEFLIYLYFKNILFINCQFYARVYLKLFVCVFSIFMCYFVEFVQLYVNILYLGMRL